MATNSSSDFRHQPFTSVLYAQSRTLLERFTVSAGGFKLVLAEALTMNLRFFIELTTRLPQTKNARRENTPAQNTDTL